MTGIWCSNILSFRNYILLQSYRNLKWVNNTSRLILLFSRIINLGGKELNKGMMWAFFHWVGTFPWLIEAWKSNVTAGAISSAVCFRSMVGIPSGPEAAKDLRFFRSSITPFTLTLMLFVVGWLLTPRSESGAPLSDEKTDVNCHSEYWLWFWDLSGGSHLLSVVQLPSDHYAWLSLELPVSCSFHQQVHYGCHGYTCCRCWG